MKKVTKLIVGIAFVIMLIIVGAVLFLKKDTPSKESFKPSKPSLMAKDSSKKSSASHSSSSSKPSNTDISTDDKSESSVMESSPKPPESSKENQSTLPAQSSTVDLNNVANGDLSSITGTWVNDLGESITISANRQVKNDTTGRTYSLSSNGIDSDVYYGSIYNPNSSYDNAAFIVIPSGTPNPHFGDTSTVDRILMGQGTNADEHPYTRN